MVFCGMKNILPVVTPRDHVIKTTLNLDSRPSCHGCKIVSVHLTVRKSQKRRPDPRSSFIASDGSGLKYVQTGGEDPIFRLYMPDGSFYDFNSELEEHLFSPTTVRKAIRLTDVNGNYIAYNAPNTQSGIYDPYGSWTDQLGRIFPIMVPLETPQVDGDDDHIVDSFTLPGMSAPYVLTWKRLDEVFGDGEDLHFVGGTDTSFAQIYSPTLFDSAVTLHNACGEYSTKLYVSGMTFNWKGENSWTVFDPYVLAEIELPNGFAFQFKYNEYGEIERIDHPTGGHEEFDYDQIASLANMDLAFAQTNRGVTESRVYENDSDPYPLTSTYSAEKSDNNYRTSVVSPDGTQTDNFMHRGIPEPNCFETFDQYNEYNTRWGYDAVLSGRTYETRVFSSGSPRHIVQRTLTKWEYTSSTSVLMKYSGSLYMQFNPRVHSSESITYNGDAWVSTVTKFEYDTDKDTAGSPLNVTAKREYAFTAVSGGSSITAGDSPPSTLVVLSEPSTGSLLRSTETTYKTDTAYKNRNLLKLPTQVIVRDGGSTGTIKSKSTIDYDESTYLVGDTTGGTVPGWTDPSSTVRGLATTTKSWYDPSVSGSYITSHVQYNQFGSPRKTWDGNGNMTETVYTDNFSDSVNRYTFAFPTETISATPGGNGSTSAFHAHVQYNFPAGLPVLSTDINGQQTQMEYNDALLRPTKVKAPNSQQTMTEYGAGTSASTRWVRTSSQIDSITSTQALMWYDGLSRTVRNESVDDAGNVSVMTCYDSAGRVSKKSNPFRGYTNETCSSSLEWTSNTYDVYSRPWKITTPDNAVVETTYGVATSGSNIGTWVSVKDQANKERRSVTNALGQLTRVDEPTASGLGTTSSPNQPTSYTYDVLNNLLTVGQSGSNTTQCGGLSSCSQTRTFTYDGLSRLKTAANPESGTISYGYDSNGNLTSKSDARSITTSYTYDTLNRVQTRTYNDYPQTPTVTYYYDNLTNAKGKLIKVTNANSTTEYTSFDILGRVTGHKQTTDGTDYTTGYTYNLAGGLVEETYPSGRVVRNVLDTTGDLSIVESKKNSSSGFWHYADSFSYTAAGAVSSMQLGNGHWESTHYNNRLQPDQIYLGTAPSGSDLLKLDYSYGTTNNNGNVLTQTITVPTVGINTGFTAVQSYTYDELNRLLSATEMESTTQTWKQTFKYDRYGNRRFDEANTTMPASFANQPVTDPTINANNNRINATGYTFDSAGNMTVDAGGQNYTYDAENKQTQVTNGSGTLGQYWYDGDGKRVKKYVPGTGETTVFVYDAMGKQIAEYSTIVAGTSTAKVNYLTNDHLGSPRINTDQNGAVICRHDYHPFGEEIDGVGGRTTGLNYGEDSVRKQFTAYEKDIESGLEFAQARMYSHGFGRFTAPDPLLNSGHPGIPQSWNRYVFAANSPLKFNDVTGLFEWDESLAEDPSLGKKENARRAGLRKKILDGYDKLKAEIGKAATSGKLSTQQLAALNNALNALGPKPGEAGSNNGVTIGIGTVDKSAVGETKPTFTFQQDTDGTHGGSSISATISVKFTESFVNSDRVFAGLLHEGAHVFDMQTFASHPETVWSSSNPYNLTQYQSEVNAFNTNSYLSQAMGVDGSKVNIPVWNNAWTKADKKLPTVEQSREGAVNSFIGSNYSVNGSPMSAANQGYAFSDYGIGVVPKK